MSFEQILTETIGRVGVIRLNRPEKLNAWTDVMAGEMTDQIQAWNEDDGIGAIIITGEGRAFCAGADLQGFNQRLADDPQARARRRPRRQLDPADPRIQAGHRRDPRLRGRRRTHPRPAGRCPLRRRGQQALDSLRQGRAGTRARIHPAAVATRRTRSRDRYLPLRTHGPGRGGVSDRPGLGSGAEGRPVRHRTGQGRGIRQQPDRGRPQDQDRCSTTTSPSPT